MSMPEYLIVGVLLSGSTTSASAEWLKEQGRDTQTGLNFHSVVTHGRAEYCPKLQTYLKPILFASCAHRDSVSDIEGFRFGFSWGCGLETNDGTSVNRVVVVSPEINTPFPVLELLEGGTAIVKTGVFAWRYLEALSGASDVGFEVETSVGALNWEFSMDGFEEVSEPLFYHCEVPFNGRQPWKFRSDWE